SAFCLAKPSCSTLLLKYKNNKRRPERYCDEIAASRGEILGRKSSDEIERFTLGEIKSTHPPSRRISLTK
ncbi:MAG: hypothetical protein J5766_02550, partial [Clostridia bacterium]|nr:hypothetical protein [Clostridia bacterium]